MREQLHETTDLEQGREAFHRHRMEEKAKVYDVHKIFKGWNMIRYWIIINFSVFLRRILVLIIELTAYFLNITNSKY